MVCLAPAGGCRKEAKKAARRGGARRDGRCPSKIAHNSPVGREDDWVYELGSPSMGVVHTRDSEI